MLTIQAMGLEIEGECVYFLRVFCILLTVNLYYSRLSLSRNRKDPQKNFEISVLRHIRFVVLRKK